MTQMVGVAVEMMVHGFSNALYGDGIAQAEVQASIEKGMGFQLHILCTTSNGHFC